MSSFTFVFVIVLCRVSNDMLTVSKFKTLILENITVVFWWKNS